MPKIILRISRDGNVTQRVVGSAGSACEQLTARAEEALGIRNSQVKHPEYDDVEATAESAADADATA